jgi:hypothetical protein
MRNPLIPIYCLVAALWASGVQAQSIPGPAELRPDLTTFNLSSARGVPVSSVVNTPVGSDGRAPREGTQLPPLPSGGATVRQFQSAIFFGSGVRPVASAQLRTNLSLAANAVALDLPRLGGGTPTHILLRARVGSPILSRGVNYLFGSIIPVPDTDENGVLLSSRNPVVRKEDYWSAEPYSTNKHAGAPYYWSPNARVVFATKPGSVAITWRRISGLSTQPAGTSYQETGLWYSTFQQKVLVSGSLSKPSRVIYWTQGDFARMGKPVDVPGNRVSDIKVVYNDQVPERVEVAYPSASQIADPKNEGERTLDERRTLWFERSTSQILAYNREGRVFVEILGDANADGASRRHLGYEIVDVLQQPRPQDITVELGDRIPAFADLSRDYASLYPKPQVQIGDRFYESTSSNPSLPEELYAARETKNQNDLLVYWMDPGIEGLMWPRVLARYNLRWPVDLARYSHYIRPQVATKDDAKGSAVLMDASSTPLLLYQDPLDQPRAFLDADLQFYTHLTPTYPAHRTLLRYSKGDRLYFERVFSWLDSNLRSSTWVGSVATNLNTWNPTNLTLTFPRQAEAPRVLAETVDVGQRITAPEGELGVGSGQSYLAGYIRSGTSYHPGAYKNPFAEGFDAANAGAIIPVNAIPSRNSLEVWWFRRDAVLQRNGIAVPNWPAVMGRYTLQFPTAPREIVLASNAGTGGLASLEAKGSIYYENDPNAIGYNPNEEHALMIGGQGYALRDDLNITTGGNFSSLPFVLIDHTGSDGRPSMAVFRVLREKPETGLLFDYVVEAGKILQAPMPLPLMQAPTEGEGVDLVNYNQETVLGANQGNLPVNWNQARDGTGPFKHYQAFSIRDRKESFWVYRGLHLEPNLQSGRYNSTTRAFEALPAATAISGRPFKYYIHASRRAEALILKPVSGPLPAWLRADIDSRGFLLTGEPPSAESTASNYSFDLIDVGMNQTNRLTLNLQVRNNGTEVTQAPLALTSQTVDGTSVQFVGRPPFLAARASDTNSFSMRFYYKTLDGFAWPNQPPIEVGTIVPYLRVPGSVTGTYVGAPADKATAALSITYRPVWPSIPAVIQPGQTLTTPVNGLPAIRGQTSAQILYQQSIATNFNLKMPSVVLVDPTRRKVATLASVGLERLPSGVLAEANQGLTYFPNLPPHLATRVFYDPNVGPNGALVLKGEFKGEFPGREYLQMNVLRGTADREDLKTVLDLCPSSPADEKSKWDQLVNSLTAVVETFVENPRIAGQYVADPQKRANVGVSSVVEITDEDTAVDSYALSTSGPGYGMVSVIVGNGAAFTPNGEPVSVLVFKVDGGLWPGELRVIPSANPLNELLTLQHTPDLAGRFGEYEYDWRIAAPVDGAPPPMDATMSQWLALQNGTAMPRYTLGGAGVRVLSDNYLIMRYRSTNTADPQIGQWSRWTEPQLAEGWIKRVLAGINPFQQRVTDLYNNPVNTDVSVLAQAGRRWEGAVALNLNNINSAGLIEIYETVLRRGRDLSIDAGINYGPANDALLLVAGYLNDLYTLMGDEAYADSANPTIAVGTGDSADGGVATAKFSFSGQVGSLLEEELALLRGRDDFMQPGVQTAPAYNRMYWNFTRGINSGEVIYVQNYNIKDLNNDGVLDALDAAKAYPQGHGDAYGHYLTAVKGYYGLIINQNFDWVPRTEAVTILGKPVQVDYLDERKFAASAAAVSQMGFEVMELVFRQSYRSGEIKGWTRFGETRSNTNRVVSSVRHWGLDHWASRVGQGAYLNWVVGNSLLPSVDPDPSHEGIQKIDRTTVLELTQLPLTYRECQLILDNAEAGLTPLGLPRDSVALDINPNQVTGASSKGHYEQLYERAIGTLENASMAFDEARTMSEGIRSQEDSLEEVKSKILDAERAVTSQLIEIYGSPYSDDIGPGKTFPQDYVGPDLVHYLYVDMPEHLFPDEIGDANTEFEIPIRGLPPEWQGVQTPDEFADFPVLTNYTVQVTAGGFTPRPDDWSGRRASPGRIQQAISEMIAAQRQLANAASAAQGAFDDMEATLDLYKANQSTQGEIDKAKLGLLIADQTLKSVLLANDLFEVFTETTKATVGNLTDAVREALPTSLVAGLAAGGDLTSGGRAALESAGGAVEEVLDKLKAARLAVVKSLEFASETSATWTEYGYIAPREELIGLRQTLKDLADQLGDAQGQLTTVNQRQRELYDAQMKLRSVVAQGERIQADRQAFRTRSSAVIQGYRTRDVAFRLFRNEKLDRYEKLLDLAASYTLLAANAFDYETGLLNSQSGKAYVDRIIQARALGVVRNGVPQFTGSSVGDPGLSGALAEMNADWSVLKGRLGFNNPDSYGTTVSLRTENYRILPGADGDMNWKDVLNKARRDDLLDDVDVRRMCMQLDRGGGLAVPGLLIEFDTTITDGMNLFGQTLAAGDHAYHNSAFATKIFGIGVALEGYKGMDTPFPNASAIGAAGAISPADPTLAFMDPTALAATPYVYLIPAGLDSMRSPPLGDESRIRTWSVQDVTIPMPFNIGDSDFSTKQLWQSSESLTEPLFSVRKHQAFRPVPSAAVFTPNIYGSNGGLSRSQFTNSRLIGRSVWNSKWKLVIPGQTLLNNPSEGLDRFIQSVKDVKIHIVSYSFSGN